jgi:hypothetical protein
VKDCSLLYFPPCEQLARRDEQHYREVAAAIAKQERERVCYWKQDDDGIWNTGCGNMYEINNGDSPEENKMKYCAFCGGLLRQSKGGE